MLVRTPILLTAVVGLVIAASLTVFGTAYVIEDLKEMLVDELREEARLSTMSACHEIEQIVNRLEGMPLSEAVHHPDVQRSLARISSDAGVRMVEIRDSIGNVVCRQQTASVTSTALPTAQPGTNPPMAVSVEFPSDGPFSADNLIPVTIPLRRNGVEVGVFQLGVSRQLALNRIEILGAQITSSLTLMVLVTFAILILTMALVYIAFMRQMNFAQRTAESEHLADLGALASGLAHEIRNPLHAMNLHLEVVREDIDELSHGGKMDPAETSETIGRVQQQIERLNGIVGHFLNLSLPCRLSLTEMRLDHLVREATNFLQPEFTANQIELKVEMPEEELTILGDHGALHQVLMNVLLNARQALSKCGYQGPRVVRVRTEKDRKAIGLLVEDSGPGIPENEREVIFKAFVSKQCGGTGVGLSIARKIMAGHRGQIRAGESDLGGALIALEFPDPRASTLIPRAPLFRESFPPDQPESDCR
ncbi:hypothetical protein GC173_00345 [bacterium]|nr:hypothetical protein [bacterium]